MKILSNTFQLSTTCKLHRDRFAQVVGGDGTQPQKFLEIPWARHSLSTTN